MKHYVAPRWSGEILDCAMPMTFDTYSRCSYGCLYCFGLYQKSNKRCGAEATTHQPVTWVNDKAVRALFELKKTSQFNEYIRQRKVMQWGGLTDQFDENERRHGVTLKLLRMFKELDYPLRFSTKATWWLDDPRYTDLIRGQRNWFFMVSIICLDEKLARKVEPGVDSPQKRIEAIAKLAELDCAGQVLRLRPFVVGLTDRNDEYLELIRQCASAGAQGVSTEFFCLERRSSEDVRKRYARMSEAIGLDLVELYRRLSTGSGYLRLNRKVKRPYVKAMRQLCEELGIRFNVSDPHWKEQGCSSGCCSLPDSMNYSRGQFTHALMLAKANGEVRWAEIAQHLELYKGFLWRKAEGLNTQGQVMRVRRGKQTMYDFIRGVWNTPNGANSPYRYFDGVLVPDRLDDDGNVVYRYDYERAEL